MAPNLRQLAPRPSSVLNSREPRSSSSSSEAVRTKGDTGSSPPPTPRRSRRIADAQSTLTFQPVTTKNSEKRERNLDEDEDAEQLDVPPTPRKRQRKSPLPSTCDSSVQTTAKASVQPSPTPGPSSTSASRRQNLAPLWPPGAQPPALQSTQSLTPSGLLSQLALSTPRLQQPLPPATIPQPRPRRPFSLLFGILRHPEIILRLATIVEIADLISLYAISKPFHFIMNSHYTTYIRASCNYHAPDSGYIFPWRCYKRLTMKDPSFRMINSMPTTDRDVPGLKWLQMVTNRHQAVMNIIHSMKKFGHCMVSEREMVIAIKKLWFIMDLPRSGARIAVMHNANYWTDKDIFLANFFLIKLDMRFTDPVEGNGETKMRELMLGQRGLYQLRDLLEGKLSKFDIVRMWVRYDYRASPPRRNMPIFGIHPSRIGTGNLEGWGTLPPARLIRPDELIVRESIRRSLGLHLKYMEMMRWGYLMQSRGRPKSNMVRLGERRPLEEKWQRSMQRDGQFGEGDQNDVDRTDVDYGIGYEMDEDLDVTFIPMD